MAINTLSSKRTDTKFNVDSLESASADLYVADALLLSAEHFVDNIRGLVAPRGLCPNERLFADALRAMTLLDQLRDKVQEAKVAIDGSVDAAIADGLNRHAARH